jgi:hypothetical protein
MEKIFAHKLTNENFLLKKVDSSGTVGTFFLLDSNLEKIPALKKNGFPELDVKGEVYFETRICKMASCLEVA